MSNLIDKAKLEIDALLQAAYERAAKKNMLNSGAEISGIVEIPKDTKNGDYAANHALSSAKALKTAPRIIAEALCVNLELEGSCFKSATPAGPGFINFMLSDKWYDEVIKNIEAEGEDYGRIDAGAGEKVMVEFVSANPTGPMTIGNARGGVLGDALASVLDRAGFDVQREFYVNDAGNQVELFGRSIDARYRQIVFGEASVEFPDNGYHGDDIRALAQTHI